VARKESSRHLRTSARSLTLWGRDVDVTLPLQLTERPILTAQGFKDPSGEVAHGLDDPQTTEKEGGHKYSDLNNTQLSARGLSEQALP